MCKSLAGLRMPISVAEGNRRPHDPVQAAKFASEAGVVIRHQVPILTHWKHYKKPPRCLPLQKLCGEANCMYGHPLLTFNSALSNFNGFTFHSYYCMQSRMDINRAHRPTQEAWWNVLQSGVRQARYGLKQTYFNGVSAD
jgi:hypothetical protein